MTTIADIIKTCEHGERKLIAFIRNRHQSRVALTDTLKDALNTHYAYGGNIDDVIADWEVVASYGDLAQYTRNFRMEVPQ